MKNTLKKVMVAVVAFALLIGTVAVAPQKAQAAGDDWKMKGFSLQEGVVDVKFSNNFKVKKGATEHLFLTFVKTKNPKDQTVPQKYKKCQWKSSNPKVVKITETSNWFKYTDHSDFWELEDGNIAIFYHTATLKAKKKGTATITVKCGGKTYKCKITVK